MSYPNEGFTLYYGGNGVYGYSLYGDVGNPGPEPVVTGIYNIQDGYCPRYLRMQFSGSILPLYVFQINPSVYDAYPQRNTASYKTILNFDPTIDETYKKLEITLQWDRMPQQMWNDILPYSRKKVDGTSERLLFWDAGVGHYKESLMKLEYLKGEVRAGEDPVDRHNVSLKLREI